MNPILDHVLAKVNDQSQLETLQTQVSQSLRLEYFAVLMYRFAFNDNEVVDQKINLQRRRQDL